MILSLSGTQGCGKSTILSSLSNMGYNVITRKTSRSVLTDWETDLDEIYNDSYMMQKFQDEVFDRKLSDEEKYINSDDIWFTDRSYVDLLVYSTIILGHNQKCSDWLDNYFQKCKQQQNKYKSIFYISPLPFISSDGIRNSNVVFNALVDYSIIGYLKRLNKSSIYNIQSESNSDRINEILQIAKL